MQDPLEDRVFVDGVILTEVTRQPSSRALSEDIHYGLYFNQPDYWLPLGKTICLEDFPGARQAYEGAKDIKKILKSIQELSIACFPNYNASYPLHRVFLVFEDDATAEIASKVLESSYPGMFSGPALQLGTGILNDMVFEVHVPMLQQLADVPVLLGLLGKQVILRIGSNGLGGYHKDFTWVLDRDIHYDPDYPDRLNEVSLWLDRSCTTFGPVGNGPIVDTRYQAVNALAELISVGILTMLNQLNTQLTITLAFHQDMRTIKLKSLLILAMGAENSACDEGNNDSMADAEKKEPHYSGLIEDDGGAQSNRKNPASLSVEEDESGKFELYRPDLLELIGTSRDRDSAFNANSSPTEHRERFEKRIDHKSHNRQTHVSDSTSTRRTSSNNELKGKKRTRRSRHKRKTRGKDLTKEAPLANASRQLGSTEDILRTGINKEEKHHGRREMPPKSTTFLEDKDVSIHIVAGRQPNRMQEIISAAVVQGS